MLSDGLVKFGEVCHMIPKDHVAQVPYKLMRRSPSTLVSILPNLAAIETVIVEIKYF